ncbi:uncharacterized protein Dwil_GK27759 [Drosophila willistoni]|uniref:Peptidase S1 domain-containing protein n=1 Tax=Drosophila willistoni TaxID=7260 RepID=A0A0Q9WWB5_DROWI|nr:serine protease 3 [Drosophila willistoni]KRF97668.1 uncharacterized protein Dwil_GK27759 [Drosophila willistoni]
MASILFCFLASFLVLPALEAHSKSLERITNGQEAKEGQFPYIVELHIEAKIPIENGVIRIVTLCGGSIIANDWILTAAHCTENVNEKTRVIIYYGSIQHGQGQVKVEVGRRSIVEHPKYRRLPTKELLNDIALIHTKWVDFNDRIQKIALPKANQRGESFAGQWSQAAGWGNVKDGSNITPDRLQWVNLKIMENSVCRSYYRNIDEIHLCVETPGRKATCGGDSGGPLVLDNENILVGVTSFGVITCEQGYPQVFARVTEYLDWIRKVSNVTS